MICFFCEEEKLTFMGTCVIIAMSVLIYFLGELK